LENIYRLPERENIAIALLDKEKRDRFLPQKLAHGKNIS